jgi:hypothetical protein
MLHSIDKRGISAEDHGVKRVAQVVGLLAAVLVFVPHQSAAAAAASAASGASAAATCRPALKDLALSAASVPGGADVTVTVTLTCDAPAALTVRMSGFRGVTTPATLRVAKRRSAARAVLRTAVTATARRGEIEATLGRTHRRAGLTVTRTPRTCRTPELTGFSLPGLVYVGDRPTAVLRLSCAPAAPIRLSLTSSNSDLPVPAKVIAGRYYNTVTVDLAPKADQAGQYTARLTARLGSRSLTRGITVDPGLALFQIPPEGGVPDAVDLNILFTGGLPAGGLTVKLASDSPAVSVPASYAFTQQGSLGGGVAGVTVQPVTRNTPVRISVTLGSRTLSATITLLPPFDSSDSASLTPESGAGPIYGQEFDLEYLVTLSNPAPDSGEMVTFSSPSSSVELQSTSDFITGGFTDGFVDVNTANVTGAVHTEIDATVDGVSASLAVVIEPGLASFTGLPATITGGDSFTATINLAGPVDTATTVALQPTAGILTVPGTVVIQPGHSSANFLASTVPVTADTGVQIVAMLGNNPLESDAVTVTP